MLLRRSRSNISDMAGKILIGRRTLCCVGGSPGFWITMISALKRIVTYTQLTIIHTIVGSKIAFLGDSSLHRPLDLSGNLSVLFPCEFLMARKVIISSDNGRGKFE